MNVHRYDSDTTKLHPQIREIVIDIEKQLNSENIPLKIFEAFRSPERQRYLYSIGRTTQRSRRKVTFAKAWSSYHQYGLAADFVAWENGKWSWNSSGHRRKWWQRLHELARKKGMEPLSWELPHIQLADWSISRLRAGQYPDFGDDKSWADNLTSAILRWPGSVKPPIPGAGSQAVERPALQTTGVDWTGVPTMGSAGWHVRFNGQSWRYDGKGVYLKSYQNGAKPLRTIGAPSTCMAILHEYGEFIAEASRKYQVPPELVIMTIATETAIYRKHDFTGPKTFRWESHFRVMNTGEPKWDGKQRGDYSAGAMQVLADSGRWVIKSQGLPYELLTVAPFYENKPASPPKDLPLYDKKTNIDIGTAQIKQRWKSSGDDPILVAACYNAGSLRESSQNQWRIHTYGNHLDRAASWFGDACVVMRSEIPDRGQEINVENIPLPQRNPARQPPPAPIPTPTPEPTAISSYTLSDPDGVNDDPTADHEFVETVSIDQEDPAQRNVPRRSNDLDDEADA